MTKRRERKSGILHSPSSWIMVLRHLLRPNLFQEMIPMTDVAQMPSTQSIQERYAAFKASGLKLNLTRGKPSSAQLDLSAALLSSPVDYLAEDKADCRNYGNLQGLVEARRLFSQLLGAPPDQVIVANNSSLALMHDAVVYSLLKGTCDSASPWSK